MADGILHQRFLYRAHLSDSILFCTIFLIEVKGLQEPIKDEQVMRGKKNPLSIDNRGILQNDIRDKDEAPHHLI